MGERTIEDVRDANKFALSEIDALRVEVKKIQAENKTLRGYCRRKRAQVARLLKEVREHRRRATGDWLCESCERWFDGKVKNFGFDCDLCEECVEAAVKEQDEELRSPTREKGNESEVTG